MYTYPSSDLDNPKRLLALLGSVWSRIYTGADLQRTRCRMRLEQARQDYLTMLEAVASVSRLHVPLFHIENWTAVVLLESEMTITPAGFTFTLTGDLSKLSSVPLMMNRITNPSLVWHSGDNYLVDALQKTITFREDPFTNSLLPVGPVFSNGSVTDQELMLWAFRGQFDWEMVYNHFGYVLGLNMASSEGYKRIVNCIFDAYVGGTSALSMIEGLSIICDVPITQEEVETVEDIAYGDHTLTIITDKHAYRQFTAGTPAGTAWQPGNVLPRGTPLVQGFEVTDLRTGVVPNVDVMYLNAGMLAPDLVLPGFGMLGFRNSVVPVSVTGAPGSEQVTWGLEGPVDAQAAFWAAVAAREAARGQRLYTLLAAQPGGVPTTINPLEFMVKNILRNNAMLALINNQAVGENALAVDAEVLMRKIMPPHTALIIVNV